MSDEKWIAITGCNGYIGGQTALKFKELGYSILGVDRNNSSPWIQNVADIIIPSEFNNAMFVHLVAEKNPEALIHIAGTSLVGPSITDPGPYYNNNTGNTARLLSDLANKGWNKTVIFSSSAAVYGNSDANSISEQHITAPINPYGRSKLMAEQAISDCAVAYGMKAVSLRYFNACGADKKVKHGQMKQATHLIARVIESIIYNQVFILNGDDYPTPDGTCVRDYLHVEDIANAHYQAMVYANSMTTSHEVFNLGTGKGISINQIISSVERITGKKILTHVGPRREGDPARLVADSRKFQRFTSWKPVSSDIDNIVRTAWNWYNSDEYGDRA